MDARKYIQDNYDELLKKAKCMKNFDEDVFQSTLLYIIVNEERMIEETLTQYIFHALYINFLKEYNNKKEGIYADIEPYTSPGADMALDTSIIYNIILEKYGGELLECFRMKLYGFSIREIRLSFPHIKNLNTKLKRIENYISGI